MIYHYDLCGVNGAAYIHVCMYGLESPAVRPSIMNCERNYNGHRGDDTRGIYCEVAGECRSGDARWWGIDGNGSEEICGRRGWMYRVLTGGVEQDGGRGGSRCWLE